jgi:hypothetical protein
LSKVRLSSWKNAKKGEKVLAAPKKQVSDDKCKFASAVGLCWWSGGHGTCGTWCVFVNKSPEI